MTASLLECSAIELAELIRSGQLSAVELTAACLERIDALEPQINAFTHLAHERALADAALIGPADERPFAGVPIAIKDNRAVAGMPLTMCSEIFENYMPPEDAFFVRRLRAAGFVIVGKTALPENGILPTCESRRNGETANPWALDRTPGGSSGGAAAAVAAGMLPIAHGNDGGGSIRIPASCCGLVGLKPARGRVSVGPDSGQSFLVGDGVLTHTVADTASLLDVLAGYEPGDANWAPPACASVRPGGLQRPPGRLRIGLALNPALESVGLDPECERGASPEAAALLDSLGHRRRGGGAAVVRIAGLLPDFARAFGPGIASVTAAGGQIAGREPDRRRCPRPLTWALYRQSA